MKLIWVSIVAMTGIGGAALAADIMPAAQQKQVEEVVHHYLVAHPEVLVESMQTLQRKQIEEANKAMVKTQQNASKFADALFHQAKDPVAGNAKGAVTIVDFFDYQCGHCIKMSPVLEALTHSNPNVRIVYKDFPIRGPISEFAAKAALAANNQGKYIDLHKAIMKQSEQGPLTEEGILKMAASVSLNIDQLKADMKSDAVTQQIKNNYKLAQDLQLMGTPAFFIAKTTITNHAATNAVTFVPGQADQKQLQEIIQKIG